MNIWILNQYAIPPDKPGGTRHFDLSRELVELGCQVTIFASTFNHQTKQQETARERQDGQTEVIGGVRFLWVRTSVYGKNDWRRAVNMISYAFRVGLVGLSLKPRPDVILGSSPHPLAGLTACALAKARGAAFILEVRDLWPQTLVDIGDYRNSSAIVRLLRILEKFLYRRAKRIVVLLPGSSEYIMRLGVSDKKIVHIPNGVNPETFRPTDTELPADLVALVSRVKNDGNVLVVYAGAHGIANALDTLVEAAALVRDSGGSSAHFLLVGDGPEKLRLIERTRALGLKNVSFFGPISKSAVPCLLANVDIATICWRKSPLYRYGVSANKLWDYMMSGTPILWAIDSPHNPVAESGCGITVPPEDPKRLSDALLAMCNMPESKRREMGRRGREYVREYHLTPVLAAKLLRVLEEARSE